MAPVFAERGGDPDRAGKKHPLDCLLWRAERPGEPSWPSPWGRGRPGLAHRVQRDRGPPPRSDFDVQGGGSDLVFPHHEMSASEAHVLRPRARPSRTPTLHAGMVAYQGEKMSKSRGNLVFVSRLREQGIDPRHLRLALLAHHYRSDWEWFDTELDAAEPSGSRGGRPRCRPRTPAPPSSSWPTSATRWPTTSTPRGRWRCSTPGPTAGPRGDGAGAALVRDLVDARLGVDL